MSARYRFIAFVPTRLYDLSRSTRVRKSCQGLSIRSWIIAVADIW